MNILLKVIKILEDETVVNLDGDENLRNEIEDRILESIEIVNENYSDSSQNGNENDRK